MRNLAWLGALFLVGALFLSGALTLACTGRDGIAAPEYVETARSAAPGDAWPEGSRPEQVPPPEDGERTQGMMQLDPAQGGDGDGPVELDAYGVPIDPLPVEESARQEFSPEEGGSEPVPTTEEAMVFTAKLVDGTEWDLVDRVGTPTVLVFWSHW